MARKMAYGSGSIRKRADGRWEGRYVSPGGKQKSVYGHSYAVAALRAGVDVKTIQNALGHASAAMTLDRYAAYTDDMGRASIGKLSAIFPAENAGVGSK